MKRYGIYLLFIVIVLGMVGCESETTNENITDESTQVEYYNNTEQEYLFTPFESTENDIYTSEQLEEELNSITDGVSGSEKLDNVATEDVEDIIEDEEMDTSEYNHVFTGAKSIEVDLSNISVSEILDGSYISPTSADIGIIVQMLQLIANELGLDINNFRYYQSDRYSTDSNYEMFHFSNNGTNYEILASFVNDEYFVREDN